MPMTVIPAMVSIYADLIIAGVRTLGTIPEIYREKVSEQKNVQDYLNAQKG